MSELFKKYALKDVVLHNRIAVSPMCQYVAEEGVVTDWRRAHYTALARGGAGLVIVEASAVSPEGRITPGDVDIWNDEQANALAGIAASIKAQEPSLVFNSPMRAVKQVRTARGKAMITSPRPIRAAGAEKNSGFDRVVPQSRGTWIHRLSAVSAACDRSTKYLKVAGRLKRRRRWS
jgi:2,4-dienoyl-CoA reductase-like NADH-dependent reductase (Old Yellow Enzyme family)